VQIFIARVVLPPFNARSCKTEKTFQNYAHLSECHFYVYSRQHGSHEKFILVSDFIAITNKPMDFGI
jgi:hypothetical protein